MKLKPHSGGRMNILLRLDKALRALNGVALAIAGVGMFFIAFVSTADVIFYIVLGRPFSGANESVEVALAVSIVMTLAYTQYRRQHIVVDVVFQHFSPRGKRVSLVIELLVGLFCMALLSWRAWELGLESVRMRETASSLYSFPVYPWKIAFALGLTLATMEFLRQLAWICCGVWEPERGPVPGKEENVAYE
ncbi:MAG: TRAP transporter small permease subunit [Reyranellaceae bacterium]